MGSVVAHPHFAEGEVLERPDAYWAGIFDGEGCVGIYKTSAARGKREYPIYHLSIEMAWLPIIQGLQARFGGSVSESQDRRAARYKTCWRWTLRRKRDGAAMLQAIRPFLVEKADQVDLYLGATAGDIDVWVAAEKMKELKRVDFSWDQ